MNLENGDICYNKESIYFEKNLNWIDTLNMKENGEADTLSSYNLLEVRIIVDLVKDIRNKKIVKKIAIITPYKRQKRKILEALRKNKINEHTVVDTVDSFQGDEAEIVIFSVTRSKKKIDFFNKDARLNIDFSRAKNDLIIVESIDYFKNKYGKESKLSEIANFIKNNGNIIKL